MRTVRAKFKNESYESQTAAGRYNPALEMTFCDKKGKHTVTIAAGHSDDLYTFREGETTFILSINHGLGYVGMQAFEHGDSEPVGDVFLDSDTAIQESLGKKGLDLSPINIAKKLSEYVYR